MKEKTFRVHYGPSYGYEMELTVTGEDEVREQSNKLFNLDPSVRGRLIPFLADSKISDMIAIKPFTGPETWTRIA